MGFWSGVWEGVKSFGSTVARVAKAAWDFATGPSAKKAYDELEKVIDKYDSRRSRDLQVIDSPNFLSRSAGNAMSVKLNEHEEKIEILNKELSYTKKFMAVQNEFSRLRNSAELIDRGMANVKIHASSLSTHFQNMRNINGLTDDVNALRGGLKHIMRTFNHNMNVLGANSEETQLKKIEGVDVELRDGAVSLVAAFDAFDRTRELLSEEIYSLSRIANSHYKDISNLKKHAANLDDDLGRNIIKFIDAKIIPVIDNAKSGALLLQEEIDHLPSAERDRNGRLIFEEGKLKIKDDDGASST